MVPRVVMVAFDTWLPRLLVFIGSCGYGNVPEDFHFAYISCLVLFVFNFALSLPRHIN